jgi:hypothetical protein
MAASVLLGVTAWYADAQSSYAKGEAINPEPEKPGDWVAEEKKWHGIKRSCDKRAPFIFMLGILAAVLYLVSRITN